MPSIPGVFLATLIPSVPAVILLVAWSEGTQRLERQFGARMVWELAAGVTVGIGLVLYFTIGLTGDDPGAILAIVLAAIFGVLAMTGLGLRPIKSAAVRMTVAIVLAVVALQIGFLAGLAGYSVFQPA